ncbi:zinc transporter 6 [Lampetra fluviatilis]
MAASTSAQAPAGDCYYPRKLGPKPDVVPTEVTERKISAYATYRPDMVSVDVARLNSAEPVHKTLHLGNQYVSGTIHPFRKSQRSLLSRLIQESTLVASDRRSRKIFVFGVLNVVCTALLITWCSSTNSMALTAYTYLTIFDLFSLLTCLISLWITLKRPTATYSFGYDRFEVLAVFASTVLAQLGALFILKESLERLLEPPEVHTGRLLLGTLVALFFHLLTMLVVPNKPFTHVSEAASTSWLQEHVADLSRSLCGVVPGLSSFLLPRMNPFVLIDLAGSLALSITYMLIEINNYYAVDTMSAVVIAMMTFGTMYPMSLYSGKVLLQTTPSHVIGQLDKLLREASTLDGVLEFRNEHFWTVSFGSLAGSMHVRVRRDANEQLVLAHVTSRLSTLVSHLTVQIFKDDWSRASVSTTSLAPSVLHNVVPPLTHTPHQPHGHHHHGSHNPLTSTPSKSTSPAPEFSFGTPGRSVQPIVPPPAVTRPGTRAYAPPAAHYPDSAGLYRAFGNSSRPFGPMLGTTGLPLGGRYPANSVLHGQSSSNVPSSS